MLGVGSFFLGLAILMVTLKKPLKLGLKTALITAGLAAVLLTAWTGSIETALGLSLAFGVFAK